MKKFIALLIIATALSSYTTMPTAPFNIIGRWEGVEAGNSVFMTFDKEGYAIIEKNGQALGGKEFVIKGGKGSMTYKTDFTKDPDELDIVITKIATKEQKSLKGIFKVINDNQMQVCIGYDGVRPANFDTPDAMIFTRVKQ
jgi:uncharacterized protein (TIGR03067 family)